MRRPNDATSSCGASWPTGTWKRSSRVSQRRRRPPQQPSGRPLLRATPPLLTRSSPTVSTRRCDCCTRWCHSLPRSCGRSCRVETVGEDRVSSGGVARSSGCPLGCCGGRRRRCETRLDRFHVPVGQLAPHELVAPFGRLIEPELLQGCRYRSHGVVGTRQDPAVGERKLRPLEALERLHPL